MVLLVHVLVQCCISIIKKWHEYGLDNVFIKGAMIHKLWTVDRTLTLTSRISHSRTQFLFLPTRSKTCMDSCFMCCPAPTAAGQSNESHIPLLESKSKATQRASMERYLALLRLLCMHEQYLAHTQLLRTPTSVAVRQPQQHRRH